MDLAVEREGSSVGGGAGVEKQYWKYLAEAIMAHVRTYRDEHGIWRHDGGFDGCNGEILVSERHPSGHLQGMRTYTSTGRCQACGVGALRCEPVSPAAEKAGLFPWTRHENREL